MAVVCLARDLKHPRPMALEVPNPERTQPRFPKLVEGTA
jgi:hypothetical protein